MAQTTAMRRQWWWLACALVAWLSTAAHAQGDAKFETFESAVRQLKASSQVSSDGLHNITLRALRQLRDPALEPYFNNLTKSEHPALKIHGLLGVAECRADRKLDLARLAAIESAAVQAEVVTAAMDSKLISTPQCKEILAWEGLDAGVKVIVAADLMQEKQPVATTVLKEAAKTDNLSRRGMANLLLLQSGDNEALKQLQEIDRSSDPKREAAQEMLLQVALRYDLDRTAPWVMGLVNDSKNNQRMAVFALRTALRINAPGAAEAWRQQYESNPDIAHRTRMALLALQVSPWVSPKVFEPLKTSQDTLIRQIGVAGTAIASHQSAGKLMAELVAMYNPIVNAWAVTYAQRHAQGQDLRDVAMALIRASTDGPDRARAQRMDDAVSVVEVLIEKDAAGAAELLKPLITDAKTPAMLSRLIVLGLVRSEGNAALKVIEGVEKLPDGQANDFLLVLRAKSGQALSPADLNMLSLLVRGGGEPPHSLRIQAAWAYLKLTKQDKTALSQVLGKAG